MGTKGTLGTRDNVKNFCKNVDESREISIGAILQPVLCYRWCADRWLLISTLIFFYKTATYIKRTLISKLFKSTSGNNLPCQKMVDRYQYVDLNSFEIKINFVNVAVLQKNHKIENGYHLSALQQ